MLLLNDCRCSFADFPLKYTCPPAGSTLPPISDSRRARTTGYHAPVSGGKSVGYAHQPAHGSTPYSFDVFRPSSGGLVHASSSSHSPQGILRTTRADAGKKYTDEDEDVEDSSKKYACPICRKRFARPSSVKVCANCIFCVAEGCLSLPSRLGP